MTGGWGLQHDRDSISMTDIAGQITCDVFFFLFPLSASEWNGQRQKWGNRIICSWKAFIRWCAIAGSGAETARKYRARNTTLRPVSSLHSWWQQRPSPAQKHTPTFPSCFCFSNISRPCLGMAEQATKKVRATTIRHPEGNSMMLGVHVAQRRRIVAKKSQSQPRWKHHKKTQRKMTVHRTGMKEMIVTRHRKNQQGKKWTWSQRLRKRYTMYVCRNAGKEHRGRSGAEHRQLFSSWWEAGPLPSVRCKAKRADWSGSSPVFKSAPHEKNIWTFGTTLLFQRVGDVERQEPLRAQNHNHRILSHNPRMLMQNEILSLHAHGKCGQRRTSEKVFCPQVLSKIYVSHRHEFAKTQLSCCSRKHWHSWCAKVSSHAWTGTFGCSSCLKEENDMIPITDKSIKNQDDINAEWRENQGSMLVEENRIPSVENQDDITAQRKEKQESMLEENRSKNQSTVHNNRTNENTEKIKAERFKPGNDTEQQTVVQSQTQFGNTNPTEEDQRPVHW